MSNINKIYEDIFRKSTDGIVVIDVQGHVVDVNESLLKMFGYERDELLGHNINLLMLSPHKEAHDKYLREYRDKNRPMSLIPRKVPAVKKDGSKLFIELGIFELDETKCAGIIRDLQYIDDFNKQKLQEEEERNQFTANISHELRTPLNVIINMNILLKDELEQLEQQIPHDTYLRIIDYIDTVNHSGTLLLTQINDLLDYTKLMSGKLLLRNDIFSIVDCVESAIRLHGSYCKN